MPSRRSFLQVSAGLGATAAWADTPKAPLLPTVQFGPATITRVVIGSNPLFGYSHFNGVLDRAMREWMTADRRVETLHRAEAAGINTWQLHYSPDTISDLKRLRAEGSKLNVFLLGEGELQKNFGMIPEVAKHGFVGIAHHGNRTDDRFRAKEMHVVRDFTKRVRDTGAMVGVSMHNPLVMDYIESAGWDVDYYMTCFYQVSRTREEARALMGGEAPLGETFLEKDPARMTAMVRKTKRPCLGFKILGAGRAGWERGQIEAAFKFAYANIKPGDAVIVGMWPKFKDEITENAQVARKVLEQTT